MEKNLWKMDSDTAATYDNIGESYRLLGEFGTAMEWYKKALAIRENLLGRIHPDTATTYHNIGLLYSDMGDNEKALQGFKEALNIYKSTLGVGHLNTGIAYHSIAHFYQRQNLYEDALIFHIKALKTFETVSDKHPYTIDTLNQISKIYDAIGNTVASEEYRAKAESKHTNSDDF